ncbi:hypothetical protein [Thermodesulfovibrio hydrogeniphilus]
MKGWGIKEKRLQRPFGLAMAEQVVSARKMLLLQLAMTGRSRDNKEKGVK